MKKTAFALVAALMLGHAVTATALTAVKAFTDAPRRMLPLLDRNSRLDMIDYFNSGLTTKSTNAMGGKSNITELSDASLKVRLTDASTAQVAVLPAASDTLVAFISTVATPAPDSKLSVYTKDWKKDVTGSVFNKPALSDWLTPSGKKNLAQVQQLVPFLLIGYDFNPADGILTLTNNTRQFLSDDVYQIVEPFLLPTLTYRWNGKKFEKTGN